jgi:tungstate transport system ATP-binding protein
MNPSPEGPIYALRNLVKDYGDRRVLEVESLDIRRGEIFALVGPSGSGKSTLLRLMNFLEAPTGGSLRFRGVEFGAGIEVPLDLRRRVTTVFQRPMLLNRSVWENVTIGLKLRGQRDSKAQARRALERVGLSHLANDRARILSGGEAQRVALARAIVLQPDALLLDEPTANLDPYNVGLIESIVRRLNAEQGMTLVLVTHNVFQARRLADRVAFLFEGRFIEVAEVQRFFESPADPRTAAFVRGDMVY